MVKTLAIKKYEFESALTDLVNNAGLPMFVVEAVMKDIIGRVKIAADQQLEKDLREYKESLKKQQPGGAQNVLSEQG